MEKIFYLKLIIYLIRKHLYIFMPPERSIDIDSIFDFKMVKYLLK